MLLLPLVMTVALVTDNQTALRAAPHDTAPRQAVLWEGDWLEVRGERQGFLQVYDHRRERPGYVHPWQVRSYELDEQSATTAAALRSVVEFLKDGPGHESLGIGYVALYLRAAPPSAVDADLFAALDAVADRLAQRASSVVAGRNDATTAAYLEVAESYGVHFKSFDAGGHTRVCYDGEAARRVLALVAANTRAPHAGRDAVDAALSLTDPACVDPALPVADAEQLVRWQAGVTAAAMQLGTDGERKARLAIRRAEVLAQIAYQEERHANADAAAAASAEAMKLLAGVDHAQLSDELDGAWQEAGVRVNVVRWATTTPVKLARDVKIVLEPGTAAGQTCVVVQSPRADELRHCTFGVVWPSSVRVAPSGGAATVVVQPLAGWSELVLLQRHKKERVAPTEPPFEWTAEVLTPSTADPDLGYVEQAGWSPDGAHLLVVREARVPGGVRRRFQILTTASQVVEKESSTLANFPSFRRWQSAEWTGSTLALR